MKKLMTAVFAGAFAFALIMPAGFAFADAPDQAAEGGNAAEPSSQIVPFKNNVDRAFKFTFNKSGDTSLGGEERTKDDSSPAYIKVEVKNCDRCRAYIDQRTSSGGWLNITSQGKATIKKKGEFFIKVNGSFKASSKVRLTGWADSTAGNVSGKWSPDSVGSFPAINGD